MRYTFHPTFFSALALALLLCAGCVPETVGAQTRLDPVPLPLPPRCQQDGNAHVIAERHLLSPDKHHYTHVVQDSPRANRQLITDGVIAAERFDEVGPIVYRHDSQRFAFIGVTANKPYVFEYTNRARYPNVAYPIDAAPKNKWVCYTENGSYLVALAQKNKTWVLLVHDANTHSDMREIALAGQPSKLELLARNGDREGFRYQVDLSGMTQEIYSWFK